MNPILAALVQAGSLTPIEAERINRMLSDDAGRAWAEQQLASAFGRGLSQQRVRLIAALEATGPGTLAGSAFWQLEDRELYNDVIPALRTVAGERAIVAAVRTGGLADWQAINEGVIGWVEDYYISTAEAAFGSIPNLNQTARTQVGNLINQWQRGELEAATRAQGLPQLIAAMEDTFGPERGARIAVTEVTRVFSESTRAAAQANPNTTRLQWVALADEIVCSVCGPLHGQTIPKGQATFPGGYFPPAHPGCRCQCVESNESVGEVPLGSGGAGAWNYQSPS